VHSGFGRFILRRAAFAVLLVFVVSSASLVLAHFAPVDDAFGTDPAALAAERHRLGFDKPLPEQYADWLSRGIRLDFGESLRFRRPVSELIRERAANTAQLGLSALTLATLIGIPLGVFTGSRRGGILVTAARGASLALLSVPPLVTSLVLLLLAARTGWLPAGGLPNVPSGTGWLESAAITAR
jgi:peptide/nickel transport system permease protein